MEEWLAGLLGALIGAALTFFASWLLLRFQYRQLFAQTVSSNRMEWINVWRENISVFLARAEILNRYNCCAAKCKNKTLLTYEKELLEARNMITSRLNMNEELHKLMFKAINQISLQTPDKEFAPKREYILELAREILKPEWERVKNEARGKRK